MENIRIEVAFDGTAYSGWQRQKGRPTIQGELERAVSRLLGKDTVVHGAGRTDAGVHALAMTASFLAGEEGRNIPDQGFVKGLNSMLPADIRVLRARRARPDFHPRKSALGKSYAYHLEFGGPALPTRRLYCWQMDGILDTGAMAACLEHLRGTHDFSSFEAAGSRDPAGSDRVAVRTIFSASIRESGPGRAVVRLHGDGFLRHMVRNIVGTLVLAGKGRMDADGFAAVLAARDRAAAGPTAPARGLFLERVFYSHD